MKLKFFTLSEINKMQNSTKSSKTLVVLDSETCGLQGGVVQFGYIVAGFDDRILPLKAIQTCSKEIFDLYHKEALYKNPFPIHPEAEKIHGITADMVKDCEFFSARKHFFYHFTKEEEKTLVFVGHNVSGFDIRVCGLEPELPETTPFPYIDTMVIARFLVSKKLLTHEGGNKLDLLTALYCSKEKAHLNEYHGTKADNWKTIVFLRFLLGGILEGCTVEDLIFLSSKASAPNKTALLAQVAKRNKL
jgi:DNA polymerase III epsilon subunit-like protein